MGSQPERHGSHFSVFMTFSYFFGEPMRKREFITVVRADRRQLLTSNVMLVSSFAMCVQVDFILATLSMAHRWRRKGLLLAIFAVSVVDSLGKWSSIAGAFVSHSSRSSEKTGIRHRGRVAYDGTGFAGFQVQSNGKRTVQGHLEDVLSRRFNRTVRVLGAGRTDTGVHARGQAFHFDLLPDEVDGDLQKLQSSMNRMLTQDVRVWNISQAPPPLVKPAPNGTGLKTYKWHAMYNSIEKLYSYRFSTGCVMNPLLRHNRWHVDWNLDMEQLDRVLQCYEGTHEFRAFAGAIEQNERKKGKAMSTVRTVHKIDLVDEGEGHYRIDILLQGALYKMVRNMVGTAIDVCREGGGRLDEEAFIELLHQKNGKDGLYTRYNNPCKPAPPHGLTLERVFYEDDF